MERRQKKWVAFSVVLSSIILAVMLALTIDQQTLTYLRRLNPLFLVLAFGLRIGSLVCWAIRLQVMSRALGYRVKFTRAFHIVLVNLLAGAVTPGQVGGEPVRVHELSREGVKVGDATAVVLTERVLDGIVLTVMSILAIIFLEYYLHSLAIEFMILFVVAWVMMIGLTFVLLYLIRHPEHLKRVVARIAGWIEQRARKVAGGEKEHPSSWAKRVDHEIDNFHVSITTFAKAGRPGIYWGLVTTSLFWVSEFFVASLLLIGLGQPPFIIESFLFQLIIAVVSMAPLTPGSAGIAEISAASLYGLIIPSSILGVFVVLWRLLLYYFNIFIGIFAGIFIFRTRVFTNEK
jgi:uncharacterized protein (TIRG00374 family)